MEADLKLVSLVKDMVHLYDKSHPLYKNQSANDKSWQLIGKELSIPEKDCKTRWLALRSRFSKERSRMSIPGDYSEWALMKHLGFLQRVVKKRRTFGSMGMHEEKHARMDDTEEEEVKFIIEEAPGSYYSAEIEGGITSTNNDHNYTEGNSNFSNESHAKENTDDMLRFSINMFKDFMEGRKTADTCAVKSFCLSLYDDLKSLEHENLLLCKIEMLQVIHKYKQRT